MLFLTDKQLTLMCPRLPSARRAELLPLLNAAMQRFGILRSKYRVAAYVSNLIHESSDFTRTVENLNYSAKRLTQVWPTRFPTLAAAQPFAFNPRKLAARAYQGRMGNVTAEDAFNFRGRGGIQRTGRELYERATEALGIDFLKHPELLERPENYSLSDALCWSDKGLNDLADCLRGHRDANEQKTLRAICKKINGGYNGLDERVANYWRCLSVLNDSRLAVEVSAKLEQKIAANPHIPTKETHTPDEIVATRQDGSALAVAAQEEVREQVKAAGVIDLAESVPVSVMKTTATSLWSRTGGKIIQLIGVVYAALQAGSFVAWGGVAVIVIALLLLAWNNRADIKRWKALLFSKGKELALGA